jgi:putative ABC transport system permease protein
MMLLLAYKFIKFDKSKSIGIVTAIVISIFLIGQQLGLLGFLMGLMGNLAGNANVTSRDIWVIESQSENMNVLNKIDQRYVQKLRSIAGVAQTHPVLIVNGQASFLNGRTAGVVLIGSEAPIFIAGPKPERILEGGITDLAAPEALSAEFFNAASWKTDIYVNKEVEINGKSARIKLITKKAQGFGGDYMYTTLENARFYGNLEPSAVSMISVRIKEGADKEDVIARINSVFPKLRAWDVEALRSSTVREILISSNMGMSFGTLVVFAMISGFFIIGLTLYSSALDRIKDYGTLKAIGAGRGYVNRLIIAQAFLYAVMGFVVALLLLIGFQQGVKSSGLDISLNLPFIAFLFGLTLLISIGGSLFAVRKISKLEPASVF